MELVTYNQEGEEIGKIKLSPKIFGIKAKPALIHFVVTALQSNLRQSLAHTKTRAEVRGGGRKPWRQKGTGRARAGSIRSPLWRGGGIIFGPRKERSYKKKINKKIKRLALKMILSEKAADKKIIVLNKLEISKPKTKEIKKIFEKLPNKKEKTIVALEKKQPQIILSLRNIPYCKTTLVNNLNLLDLLKYKYLLVTEEGLKQIEKIYK